MFFRKKINPYMGKFEDWEFGDYIANSPDREYIVWVGNNPTQLEDHIPGSRYFSPNPLIAGLSKKDRRLLWKALDAERKKRQADVKKAKALQKEEAEHRRRREYVEHAAEAAKHREKLFGIPAPSVVTDPLDKRTD